MVNVTDYPAINTNGYECNLIDDEKGYKIFAGRVPQYIDQSTLTFEGIHDHDSKLFVDELISLLREGKVSTAEHIRDDDDYQLITSMNESGGRSVSIWSHGDFRHHIRLGEKWGVANSNMLPAWNLYFNFTSVNVVWYVGERISNGTLRISRTWDPLDVY